ncbi:MAG: hypothetical protein GX665_05325 [Gammaproteobacteria bacterium]|nr:hypothetical protein [Gammaproteobacteria bacterium]
MTDEMINEMMDGDPPEDGRLVLCTHCQQIAWHDEAHCILCDHKPLALMTPVPADDADALEVLQRFQAWRRGHDPRTLTDIGLSTAAIGEAIDAGIQALTTNTQEASHGARD